MLQDDGIGRGGELVRQCLEEVLSAVRRDRLRIHALSLCKSGKFQSS